MGKTEGNFKRVSELGDIITKDFMSSLLKSLDEQGIGAEIRKMLVYSVGQAYELGQAHTHAELKHIYEEDIDAFIEIFEKENNSDEDCLEEGN